MLVFILVLASLWTLLALISVLANVGQAANLHEQMEQEHRATIGARNFWLGLIVVIAASVALWVG